MREQQYFIDNLERAIEEGWLQVYYQPVVRSTTGKICSVEALARWIDPEQGLITPDEFVPVLEEAGLIRRLDLFVVDQILEKWRNQEQKDIRRIPHSVNLSGVDFDGFDMAGEIRKRMEEEGVPEKMLAIEISEKSVACNYGFMKSQIERFQELGFQVWLDDFGNGCASLDILQSCGFSLFKFDIRHMRSFETGQPSLVVLTELMKMAIGIGADTVCEGVETVEEEQFLREIGCEKLQGFYFSRANSIETVRELMKTGKDIAAETPEETAYYDEIGHINLYDLAVMMSREEGSSHHLFNTLPMAIMEITGDVVEFIRTNPSYRAFVKENVGMEIQGDGFRFSAREDIYQTTFLKMVLRCCRNKERAFVSERMQNNMTVHSFIRWLSDNPVTGGSAVVVAVLSIVDAKQEASYENIARALAADYFNLFYVDLETENFIHYNSDPEDEELAIERRGTDFFSTARKDALTVIHEDDIEKFIFTFTKENVIHALERQGTFTMTYRQMVEGKPVRVNMKARPMQPGDSHIIIGVNIIEEQEKLQEGYERTVLSSALRDTEAARVDSLSLDSASFAVKSCVRLMSSGEFKDNVKAVLSDLMKTAKADAARILLVDPDKKEVSIFAEVNREGCFPNREKELADLTYELVAGWEELIGDNNAIIVAGEEDLNALEKTCPEWAQRMKRDGVSSHVLIPLYRMERLLGYLYVINYDTEKTEKIRELIELVSYFLSSEISNYLFRQELEFLSNYDQLTGLQNRLAMLRRVGKLACREEGCCFGVLTMDLNGLKKMNDTMGHFAGDDLICSAARMLEEEFGRKELYRIGGDEFIVIFPDVSEEEFHQQVKAFRTGRLVSSGISMATGAFWSATNDDVDSVFYQADQNMYADKKAYYARHGGKK